MSAQAEAGAQATGSKQWMVPPRTRWESGYRRAVLLTDLVVIVICLRIGLVLTNGSLAGNLPGALAGITATVLFGSMFGCRVWERRVLGQGAEEFRRLGNAVVTAAVVLGLTALAIEVGYFRPWVFAILPATGLCLFTSRYVLRRVLHTRRGRDLCMHPVLIAGSLDEVADLVLRTRRERHYGWLVTGVCIPGVPADCQLEVHGVPVVGGLDDVPTLVRGGGYRIVAVAPDAHWTRQRLRQLAWDMEGVPTELVIAPALMEVTGPRLHVDPVYGLTLLRVSQPTFTGARWVLKGVLDRIAACSALLVLAPVMAAVALAIKLEDGGPVLFRQERVGKASGRFAMVKFRSMGVDADQRRAELEAMNEGAGPLFKLRSDPRITRVGAFIRRYSLDELPQLINVVTGDMSIVGPRPPLAAEVERYGMDARRRLLVKPGITGLWQINGRSDLTWEETVRLDLRYVENWSLMMDLVIVWKTLNAVLRGDGAY